MKSKTDTRIGREIFKLIGGRKFAISIHAKHFRAKKTRLSFILDHEYHDHLDGNYVEIYYNEDVNRYDIKYIYLDAEDRTSTLVEFVTNVREDSLLSTFSHMTSLYDVAC